MIESQIRPNQVRDEYILTAMESVPREIFVPSTMAGVAYVDEDIQVARGRYLLEPMILARLLQAAMITPHDNVLDIAPATGYSTAVIANFARQVTAIESDVALQQQATANLSSLSVTNAKVFTGALSAGYNAGAPYDVIIVNGSVDAVPQALFDQLAEAGRLVGVVRHFGPAKAAHTGEARVYTKIQGSISCRALFDANVKSLIEFTAKPSFTF